MIYEFNHIGVQVKDLEATLQFYTHILGAKVTSEAMIPSTGTDCIYVQVAGGLVELLYRPDPPPGYKFGYNHVAFMTDDLDGDHRRLEGAGYSFSVAPQVAGTGRGRLAFLSDPNDVRVELIQRTEEFRGPRVNGFVRSIDHIGLRAPDIEAARAFYRDNLGMKPLVELHGASREEKLSYLNIDDDVIELLDQTDRQSTELIAHIALRVDDVDESTEHLRRNGVQVADGSPEPAGTVYGRICAFKDPDGNSYELLDRTDLRELAPR